MGPMSDPWCRLAITKGGHVTITLEHVRALVTSGMFESSAPWGGADVIVVGEKPQRSFAVYSFYPKPLHVVTDHVGPVSWLFEQMRDCFAQLEGYGFFKEGLFGDLGDVVNEATAKRPDITAQELLEMVLDTADQLYAQFSGANPTVGGGGF